MKLLSYRHRGTDHWGAASGDGVVDLGRRLPDIASVRALLEGGDAALQRARDALAGAGPDVALTEIEYRLPVPEPRKIFCIGVNYAHRNAEYKDGSDLPKYPSIFMRVPDSFAGHGGALLQPPESSQLDYEGEIGVVIGTRGRRIARETATRHIGGLTCINEGTIRDWVHHAKFNVTQGKNFDASGAIGPWIATADEYSNGYADLRVQTRVNGESRQDDTTAHLMFDFAYLISYLSTFTTLEPGDVIATGTPTGAGIRFTPPKFLQPGDVVEVEVSGVGVLRNAVRAEKASS
ncbi:MAG TPA: fumarylacetoacetate hydrolase family protein [Caldimonas sp.]|nr:fumarylacetoacetate hydrolase family protein [Caldimonas sp.]